MTNIDRQKHKHTHKQTHRVKHYHLVIAGDNKYDVCITPHDNYYSMLSTSNCEKWRTYSAFEELSVHFTLCCVLWWVSYRFLDIDKSCERWRMWLHWQHDVSQDYYRNYRNTSNIRRTLVGNKIVDHSDVVGASPVGAAPTTSSFST